MLVSRRINATYRMPHKSFFVVDELIDICETRHFDVEQFINASFAFFDFHACMKVFKIPFPPLNSLKSKNNIHSYERFTLTIESFHKKRTGDLNRQEVYTIEMLRLPDNSFESILFCLSSGVISERTLRTGVEEGTLKHEDVQEALHIIKGRTNGVES
jgi:hypothetical protein